MTVHDGTVFCSCRLSGSFFVAPLSLIALTLILLLKINQKCVLISGKSASEGQVSLGYLTLFDISITRRR